MSQRIPSVFLFLGGLLTILILSLPISIWRLQANADLQHRSELSLADSESLCRQIAELQAVVPSEADSVNRQEMVISLVRRCLAEAGIDESKLIDVKISGKTAIPKTTFVREDASVSLKGLELDQLFAFIAAQEAKGGGMICSGIDLRIAKQSNGTSIALWEPVLTLTHLSKTATSPKRR